MYLYFYQSLGNEYKKENKGDDNHNEDDDDVGENCGEGDINIDSKSFAAKASKFQTAPNKKRNKVIIVDEEEEKEFGINTSINNHAGSIGTLHGGLANAGNVDVWSLEKIKSTMFKQMKNAIMEEDEGGLEYQKKIAGTQFYIEEVPDAKGNQMARVNLLGNHRKSNS